MVFLTKMPAIGKIVVTNPVVNKSVKGLVYFLHGPCDNGVDMQTWVDKIVNGSFAFKNFPVVYPSSPTISYTLHHGKKESIWFDQLSMSPNSPEDWGTICRVGSQLSESIKQKEQETGIPPDNIIIGGFSMGGAMALHIGYRLFPNIAGVFALSSFLPPDSRLYEDMELQTVAKFPEIKFDKNKESHMACLSDHAKFPRLFMSHGRQDPIVPISWAKSTFNNLRKQGVDGHLYTIENMQHTMSKQQLGLLHSWIEETLHAKNETSTKSTE